MKFSGVSLAFSIGITICYGAVIAYFFLKPRLFTREFINQEKSSFHEDLRHKINELEDNYLLTDKEWNDMFEIAKFADERFLTQHPDITEFISLAVKVEKIIENRKRK
ncbi:MAG: hypothetical protein AAB522_02675 [Patescibacteria group bacterium]